MRGHNSQFCEWLEKVYRHYHTHLFNVYASRGSIKKTSCFYYRLHLFSCSKATQVSLEGQILRERDVLSVMVMCGVLLS